MRRMFALTVVLLATTLASAQVVSDAEKKEGFRPLFDGKSFAGWKETEKTPTSWKIENGMLLLLGGSSDLYTKDEFEDFIVRFEWRPHKKGYDSGFYIRGSNQIQMLQSQAGSFFGKGAKGVPELHKAPGEWNEWEVSCVGSKVSLKVNGKLAWEIDNFRPKKGPMGIQAEGSAIDFKNLRIKVIEPKK